MNNIVYKILLAALVIALNLIHIYYQKRYKQTHATTESEIAPKREKLLTQIMGLTLAVPGMIWLFTGWLSFGQLALPDGVRMAGFAVGVYGVWWFYRIHRTLGDNWSPVLEIRSEHTLITTGPYRKVRHPMYSDMILWLLSFALITANWFYALTISAGLTILFSIRIPDEEKLMTARFGEHYKAYMQQTRRLIPFIF